MSQNPHGEGILLIAKLIGAAIGIGFLLLLGGAVLFVMSQ